VLGKNRAVKLADRNGLSVNRATVFYGDLRVENLWEKTFQLSHNRKERASRKTQEKEEHNDFLFQKGNMGN